MKRDGSDDPGDPDVVVDHEQPWNKHWPLLIGYYACCIRLIKN